MIDESMVAPLPSGPRPQPTPLTRPFWDALQSGSLLIQQCDTCSRRVFYPRPVCPACGGQSLTWRECTGRGTLSSYTINFRPAPVFDSREPQIIALVTLEEGPRMAARLIGIPPEPARLVLGMPLVAKFMPGQMSMPLFATAAGGAI